MKIVIVGGVAGGATLAARLRRLSETDEIIMFEKDEYIAFANCGLPYYIGDVITERDKLFVQTVDGLSKRYNLDIRNNSKVIKIDEVSKTVDVLHDDKVYTQEYDKLVLTPGANPKNFGFEAKNLFTLRNVPDTDNIKNYIKDNNVKNAVVIGGGFIGVEMAENLNHLGINVTLIDNSKHILRPFDIEMAAILETNLKASGVDIRLNSQVKNVDDKFVYLNTNEDIKTDMTILAVGVKPLVELADGTSIELTKNGAFKVNERFETSVKDIYAIGDAIETISPIINKEVYIPLAWPANRQGCILADIIHGREITYPGTYGSSILKVNNLEAAATGHSGEFLDFVGIEYEQIHVHRANHAGYYPDSSTIALKLIFDKNTKQIYGAQGIGNGGVAKRIDVIATAIKAKLRVDQLAEIELCYAPPFNSAKDPVNILGYVAENVISGKTNMKQYFEVKNFKNIIDVRTPIEHEFGNIEGSINYDLDILRDVELPYNLDDEILIYCQVGLRGYLAEQILKSKGYTNIYNLSGGYVTYNTYMKIFDKVEKLSIPIFNNISDTQTLSEIHNLDARGLQCPGPIMLTYNKMNELNIGESLEILVTDHGFCQDIEAWCNKCAHKLVSLDHIDNYYKAIIQKQDTNICSLDSIVKEDKGTIVLFSGEMDKALGAMIIAQGAQAMGKDITIFCTFWGLNLLRKDMHVKVEKTMFEKMFGFMLPRGAKKAKISNMNMMGIGTKMIKGRMKDKNVDQLPEMIISAQEAGVKFIACTMSMDLMGIKEEELIDGIEFAGVAKYVGESNGADLTLFI